MTSGSTSSRRPRRRAPLVSSASTSLPMRTASQCVDVLAATRARDLGGACIGRGRAWPGMASSPDQVAAGSTSAATPASSSRGRRPSARAGRAPPRRDRRRSLALADEPSRQPDRRLQALVQRAAGDTLDQDAVGAHLGERHPGQVGRRVGREVRGRVVDLVEELLLAGRERHRRPSPGPGGDGEPSSPTSASGKPSRAGRGPVPGRGRRSSRRDLAARLEEVADDRALTGQSQSSRDQPTRRTAGRGQGRVASRP